MQMELFQSRATENRREIRKKRHRPQSTCYLIFSISSEVTEHQRSDVISSHLKTRDFMSKFVICLDSDSG